MTSASVCAALSRSFCAMSERLITPTRRPSSTHIIRDLWFRAISRSANRTSSFGVQEMTSRLMISPIFECAGRPPATSRMARSRSVIAPITFFDSSQTGRKPTFSSSMRRAADCAVSFGETQNTSRFMISSQSMVSS